MTSSYFSRYDWYTSGQLIGAYIKWNGDGSYSNDTTTTGNANTYWIPANTAANQNDRIIYRFYGMYLIICNCSFQKKKQKKKNIQTPVECLPYMWLSW